MAAHRAWTISPAWLLFAGLVASACVDEANIPDCVRDHSCPGQAEGGDGAGSGGRLPGGGAAGSNAATGGAPPLAGRGGNAGNAGRTDGGAMSGSDAGLGGSAGNGDAGQAGDGGTAGGIDGPECESCLIRETRLDAPCAGSSYLAHLSIESGEPPFSWQVSASTPGWSISAVGPADATLTHGAVSEGHTRLTVTATNRQGEHTSRIYDVVAREACFFAFTALADDGDGELLLFDPLASEPRAVDLAHNAAVFDFQFSPDGRHLAYSYGVSEESPRGAHLSLVDLRTLEDEQLTFGEDAISAVAWSPDSTTLAASFTSGGQAYLGAVRLTTTASGSAKSALAPIPVFETTELYWVGNRFVAYHAPVYPDLAHPGTFVGGADNPNGLRTAFWAELGESGFAAPKNGAETFPPDVRLRPTPEGFFMVASTPPLTIFYAPLEAPPYVATRGKISLLSPSGLYAARFADQTAQRLRIDTATGALNDSLAISSEDCPLPLAWGGHPERVACVADVWNDDGLTKHGELRLFTLDEANGALPMETVAGFCPDDVSTLSTASCTLDPNHYAYGADLARRTARSFSTDGHYFAFTSVFDGQAFLYLAALDDGPPALSQAHYFAQPGKSGLATRLSFSPDSRSLLFQLGSELTLMDVVTGDKRGGLTNKLVAPSKCTEDFSSAPDTYCGDTERLAPWVWASDSNYLAYQIPGWLSVVDLSAPSGLEQLAIQVVSCGEACSGRFDFQPQP